MARRSLLAALLFFTPISLACGSAPDAVVEEEKEPGERKVISRASLQLRADAPEAVADDVAHLVQESGGYVAARSTSTVSAHVQQVDATLRIPAGELDTVLAEIRAQGELMHEAQTADDVTAQHTDVVAHLRSKRALEERLLVLLGTATDVDSTLKIEAELTETRAEIERLEAQQRMLDHDVALATVELSIMSPMRLDPATAESIASRLERTFEHVGHTLVEMLLGLIRFLGVVVPLAIVGVPVGLALRLLWRRGGARRV